LSIRWNDVPDLRGVFMRQAMLAVLAATLGGCGTVANLWSCCKSGDRAVYGGVAHSLRRAAEDAEEAARLDSLDCALHAVGAGLMLVDVPLSAVADTLTLPITVPETLSHRVEQRPTVVVPAGSEQPLQARPATEAAPVH
jgi:uncharacterized protein YceK